MSTPIHPDRLTKNDFIQGIGFKVTRSTHSSYYYKDHTPNILGIIKANDVAGNEYIGNVDGITDRGFSWFCYTLGRRVGHFVLFSDCIKLEN